MNSSENQAGYSHNIQFKLKLSVDEYKTYYQGQIRYIQVQSHDGRSIRFPASAIRKFLTPDGISGDFEIQVDQNNKLVGISKKQ